MKKHGSEGGKKSVMRSTMWASEKGTEGTWKIGTSTEIDGGKFQFEGLRSEKQIWNEHQGMQFSDQVRIFLSSNEDSANATSEFHT